MKKYLKQLGCLVTALLSRTRYIDITYKTYAILQSEVSKLSINKKLTNLSVGDLNGDLLPFLVEPDGDGIPLLGA